LIRTFIAVTLAASTVEEIAKVQAELKEIKADIRWVRAENMHLTLKFLGDTNRSKIGPILEVLHTTLQRQPAFSVHAQGLGGFPDLTRPRMVWAGLTEDRLIAVSHAVETALVPLDFPMEQRPFRPHLTLGRVRSQRGWSDMLPPGLTCTPQAVTAELAATAEPNPSWRGCLVPAKLIILRRIE
jgi:2'-5' RNA ligase